METKQRAKRFAALFMALVMILTALPLNAFAADPQTDPASEPLNNGPKDLVEQPEGKSYKDTVTEKMYYKTPNWSEESVKNKGVQKWDIRPEQKLRSVSIPSEPLETTQLNYKGYHEDANGNLILDLTMTWGVRSANLWGKADLFISNDLNKKIDWTASSYYNGYKKEDVRFENGKTKNQKTMDLSEMAQAALAGNVHHTPIRLVLKNTKRTDLDTIDTTIQVRVVTPDGNQIYTKYLPKTDKSNLVLEGYNSYTSVTTIPKTTSTNFRKGVVPVLRNYAGALGNAEQIPDVQANQTGVSFHPATDELYIASQFRKGSTGINGKVDYKVNDELMGYRLAFNKELLDVLKEDKNGYIGYVEPSTTSGRQSINLLGNVTGFTRNQVNVEGNMAYVIYAPQGYEAKNGEQVVTTTGGTNGFINNQTTLLTGSQYTVTRLNVNSDKLKSLYPEMTGAGGNTYKPELLPLDIYTAMVLNNSKGMDTVSVTTTKDIVASKGSNVQITFEEAPAKDFIKGRSTNKGYKEASKLGIKLADLPLAGDLAVYRSGTAGGAYDETNFTLSNEHKTYTSQLLTDAKIPAGSTIKLYVGYGAHLVGNGGKIYINNQEVASFGNTDAKTSYEPRVLVGTEAYSSTLLDRTQYMPALLDTFDTSKKIEGYTYVNDQAVEMAYNDNTTKTRKFMEALSSLTATPGAKYVIDDTVYPLPNMGLYKFSKEIGADDTLVKDAPIAARAYHYDVADQDKDAQAALEDQAIIKSAVGSDPVIAKVMSTVTFDLNGGKYNDADNATIKSFEGGHPGTGYETTRQAANSPVIRILPINKHFATDKDYVANGFVGENAVLKDNTGVDLTGDSLALRKFAETDADGKNTIKPEKQGAAFLGWTTQKLTGTPADVTKAFKALTVADTAEKTNDATKNYIFTDKTPATKSIRVYAAYGVPLVKFHTNPPKDAKDAQGHALTDKITEQTITEQAITDREIQLNKNYGTEDFTIPGYSLVGYSTNPDATEPDENITGTGFEKDLYLRDNDVMKLTEEQANKGIELYAVWRPNYHVDVTKVWAPDTLEANNKGKIKVGLLTRPAVGTQGQEVITEKAVYRPVPGTVKALSDAVDGKLTWENLKSYDEKGHRMSYIAVELTASTEALFKAGSIEYEKYGVDIREKHEENGQTIWGHKDQLLTSGGVDAMTAATTRNHYNAEGTAVDPHSTPMGYFGTYGYSITLTNKEAKVQPPKISPVIDGQNNVEVITQGDPDKVTVTLPDSTTIVLKKDGAGKLVKDASSTSTATVTVDDGGKATITLPDGKTFATGEIIKAKQEKIVGEASAASDEITRTVEAKPVSNKVTNITQQPKDESGNVPVKFQVPNPPVDPPKKDTKYTIGTVDEHGNFTPIAGVDPITLDADVPSDTSVTIDKTFTIPADKLDGIKGKDLVIKSEEPNKAATDSDKFKLDLTAPTATVKAEDEIWRRWVDVRLSQLKGDAEVIVVNYKDVNGTDQIARFNDTNEAEEAIEVLRGQNVTDMKITLKDKYGNVNEINPTYTATKVIKINIRTPRLGKNFVQVRSAQDATTVSVRIFNASDAQAVKERAAGYADKATHKAMVTLNKDKKFTKITFDDGYKLTAGDIIEFVGTTEDNGITNPYAFILGK